MYRNNYSDVIGTMDSDEWNKFVLDCNLIGRGFGTSEVNPHPHMHVHMHARMHSHIHGTQALLDLSRGDVLLTY